jgi:hypothetical protein
MQASKSSKSLMVIAANGIIMALYLALTILVAPISSGPDPVSDIRKLESSGRFQPEAFMGGFRRSHRI